MPNGAKVLIIESPIPAVPINASRSFSLLLVVVAASGLSVGSAARMIAGAAKVAAAAVPSVLTKDRREVELPDIAIFLLLGSYGVQLWLPAGNSKVEILAA